MEPELDAVAVRVLGSLLEKEVTVPASYPLTMNALLSACNQTSGRNPLMEVTEAEVDDAVARMKSVHLVRLVHASHGARTLKYRQVADETLRLDPAERAIITLLLLRGPQTPGELRARSERLHPFASLTELEDVLAELASRPDPYVCRLDRQPGRKEERWAHLLGGAPTEASASVPSVRAAPSQEAEPLLPALAPVAEFVGLWRGAGAGEYPTVNGFAYTEEIELRPVAGKPQLSYRSTTRAADDGRLIHGEAGWLRVVDGQSVELVVAQGPGLVEITEGVVEGGEMLLTSTLVAGSTSAKEVTATERHYHVAADTLGYELAMAAVGQPLTHHLRARLTRQA